VLLLVKQSAWQRATRLGSPKAHLWVLLMVPPLVTQLEQLKVPRLESPLEQPSVKLTALTTVQR